MAIRTVGQLASAVKKDPQLEADLKKAQGQLKAANDSYL